MASQKSEQLRSARRKRCLIQFTRPFEKEHFHGRVLEVASEWFLLATLDEGWRFNGYQCLRISDTRRLQVPHPNNTFIKQALKIRNEQLVRPRVNMASLERLLQTAGRAFPLVTLFFEKTNAEVCYIGRVVATDRQYVTLLAIGPDASWDAEATSYRLSEITRVDFGGAYEEALHLVSSL